MVGWNLRKKIESIITIAKQVRAYHRSKEDERQNYYDKTFNPLALRERFIVAGVPVEDARISLVDFERWLGEFDELSQFYQGSDVHIEKCLEHYLSYKWLNLSQEDVYIDVAAASSVWAEILIKREITAYKLDLKYPAGINDVKIGAEAGDTGLPAGFASAMSLQCAYETFRGDADIRFIQEAKRVLNHRGRFAIIPLYTDETYFNMSSPYVNLSGIEVDEGAIRVWREDAYKEPFSRHYSPEAFAERIYSQIKGLTGRIVYFTNLDEIRTNFNGQRIYCNFMFYCERSSISFIREKRYKLHK
ncbi:MAG: hypothetical protein ABH851_09700 [Methanobacteriota archaeon]